MTAPTASAVIQLPFGPVAIYCNDSSVDRIMFLPSGSAIKPPQNALSRQVIDALHAYIGDPFETNFDLPLAPVGTEFQHNVWQALQDIKCGETLSYSALAKTLGSGARAVGNACRHNPLPLIVPCHRVVAKNGMGGFAGDREGGKTTIKHWLLRHEGIL